MTKLQKIERKIAKIQRKLDELKLRRAHKLINNCIEEEIQNLESKQKDSKETKPPCFGVPVFCPFTGFSFDIGVLSEEKEPDEIPFKIPSSSAKQTETGLEVIPSKKGYRIVWDGCGYDDDQEWCFVGKYIRK